MLNPFTWMRQFLWRLLIADNTRIYKKLLGREVWYVVRETRLPWYDHMLIEFAKLEFQIHLSAQENRSPDLYFEYIPLKERPKPCL